MVWQVAARDDGPVVPIDYFEYLSAELGDPEWLVAGTALEGQRRPFPRFATRADFSRLCRNTLGRVQRNDLHLHATPISRRPLRSGMQLGLQAAPDLGSALALLAAYWERTYPFADLPIAVEGERCEIRFLPRFDGDMIDVIDVMAEGCFRAVYHYIAEYPRTPPEQIRIEIETAPIADADVYGRIFRCPIRFGAPRSALSFPQDWRGRANARHDPGLWALALARCEADYAEIALTGMIDRMVQRLRTIIEAHGKPPRIEMFAGLLGLSKRSLNRRLAERGTTYQALAELVQKERVLELMLDPAHSLQSISDVMGFSDQSSFGRSFRRWFDANPGRYRDGICTQGVA